MIARPKSLLAVVLGLIAACLAPGAALAQTTSARPNIVLIYADDVGYGDLSSYGATRQRTPRIDRLAKEGLRFTDAHAAAATCTPSRYALLTGQYAWRQQGTGVLPGSAALIVDPARPTLPRMLQRAGYVTGIVGKWHLGLGPAATASAAIAPRRSVTMEQICARFPGRTVTAGLVAILWLGPLGGCTFDPKLPEYLYVDVPVVICDRRASSCSVGARNELAWIGYFGDAEFVDTSLGAPATGGQPIAGGGGCQFDGTLSIPGFFSSGRLLALDEDDWVTECSPGAALFSWDEEQGHTVILGTAVFHRGEQGCVIRTANFCS